MTTTKKMNQTNSGRKPINAGDDTSIFNAQSNGNNGGSSTQRSPLNSGAINPTTSRYDTSPPTTTNNNNNANRNYTPPQHQPNVNTARANVTARQQQALGQHQSRNFNATNHQNSNETTPRQTSPARSNQNVPEGFRIAKRELWWKEPGSSGHKVLTNDKPKVDHVTPKVDCYNNEYNPNRQNTKLIESKKLEWNANHGILKFFILFFVSFN